MLSVHCCAGYATIYTVASGHKEATINARRAEMLYMAACRVLRDRAAAPSQSAWVSPGDPSLIGDPNRSCMFSLPWRFETVLTSLNSLNVPSPVADETLGRRFAKAEFGAAGRLLPGRVSEGNL